jgi:hypothetical protein
VIATDVPGPVAVLQVMVAAVVALRLKPVARTRPVPSVDASTAKKNPDRLNIEALRCIFILS